MLVGVALLSFLVCASAENISIIAAWKDTNFQVLKHFWKNTGLSPLGDPETRKDYLLSHDEKVNLALIGSVPNQGITHVRIHWILDLVTVKENGPVFDYRNLDELIDWLHQHRLVPGFELMGNPSNYFYDFRTQADDWHLLIKQILSRYMDMYGPMYMYDWRFELMNEPDLRMYNSYNFTLTEYLDYFRASERALGKLHGPAGLFRSDRAAHPLCWGLLDYCNFNPCKLKTITFHRKGDGAGSKVLRRGLDLINTIQRSFPNLTHLSLGNDEADIMTGWYKPADWRSDVRYASLVLQVIIGHVNEMYVKRNIPFEILSNDNAFLNYHPHYFTQRTLLARFQMNNTHPPHVQFFRKPVYTVMGLLSLLGSYVIDIQYEPGNNRFSYILTAEKYRVNFLGTITNNTAIDELYNSNGSTFDIVLRIALQDSADPGMYAVYLMDNAKTNPYQVWKDGGSPDFPDKALRRKMRASEGVSVLQYQPVKAHQYKITVSLPKSLNPSIVSINYCSVKSNAPGRVENLHFIKVNNNEVLLLWSDEFVKSKCLKTYEVKFKGVNQKRYRRISFEDSLFLSYHFDGNINGTEVSVLGDYKVAAVDYFGRYGRFSTPLTISSL
ncbi:UNVERIFIED_CONTAM: hypothetical protein PYX00_007642 [Menopon gallinae]|uniref:Alpha-L-iduronidase n=1 Tax=Menopon gallinae TaxID=328185 RepID=A0AAW2HK58_9NEOP